ncbi:sialidase-1 [Maribacter ulvicola]|uniref:exo-alpha-sialidase n=2 Tax=Maribacter ulvicola TaxID=228959 RepID=A0A1N6X9Z1_9FLAO|nr:sialidase-1 [Maribacter ulvicola]
MEKNSSPLHQIGVIIKSLNSSKFIIMKNKVNLFAVYSIMAIVLLSCGEKKILEVSDFSYEASQPVLPVLTLKDKNKVVQMKLTIPKDTSDIIVSSMDFNLEGTTDLKNITNIDIYSSFKEPRFETGTKFGSSDEINFKVQIDGHQPLQAGDNYFWLSMALKDSVNLTNKISANSVSITLSNGQVLKPSVTDIQTAQRIGVALRQHNQDNVDTYRIPGMVTTNNGTLIAVYDNRYEGSVDLQADADVGMSRSTDGGTTWEPMKVIMDMGEYGGKPQNENGIGDPSILVDRNTGTIWVAAVWAHGHPGERNWHASKPGISPEETSQFVLVKSEDDGLTWSDPINITSQIKKPEWQLLLQGPGKGITLKDGTLVFPAQFKDKDRMPHSTIIYSKDSGLTWKIGTGARSNTTEAQVVQLDDESLMLNMRDNRGGSRAVAITKDLGQTWEDHDSSRKALIEPVCMASLISFDHSKKGKLLFFFNPNNDKRRANMTIKTSFDQGLTWPTENQLELYEDSCYGYSCMTVIDENHIGILYEGNKELYFEKVNINELF